MKKYDVMTLRLPQGIGDGRERQGVQLVRVFENIFVKSGYNYPYKVLVFSFGPTMIIILLLK